MFPPRIVWKTALILLLPSCRDTFISQNLLFLPTFPMTCRSISPARWPSSLPIWDNSMLFGDLRATSDGRLAERGKRIKAGNHAAVASIWRAIGSGANLLLHSPSIGTGASHFLHSTSTDTHHESWKIDSTLSYLVERIHRGRLSRIPVIFVGLT